jgi:hypothetical protein
MYLNYYQSTTGFEPRLALFVLPDDPDGTEDVEELHLYHDLEGLHWVFTSADWVTIESEGQIRIGAYGIAALNEPLPSGQFRVELIDKGGEHSERRFGFEVPRDSKYPFPTLSVSDGNYRIESRYPEHYFLCYNATGEYQRTVRIEHLEGSVTDLRLASAIRGVALWAFDPELHTSALTDMAAIR